MGQRLGQHFLINEDKLRNVANALEIKKGDIVIEIGPGHGELTRHLLEAGACVTALERDKQLIEPLKEKFFPYFHGNDKDGDFEVIEGNALELLPMVVEEFEQKGAPYMIAGNIPYYITGHLLRVIEELGHKPTKIALTIQKEVAERICAMPPRMNLLAASVQFWAEATIVDSVPKKDFNPPPKVDSATILLAVRAKQAMPRGPYYACIKKLFAQPRKTIVNNLAGKDGDKERVAKLLQANGIVVKARPHVLDMQAIIALAKLFSSSGMI